VHAWVYGLTDGLLRDLDFRVSDVASTETEFERAVGLGASRT